LANFDVTSLRVIWFCSGALIGLLSTAASHLEKEFLDAKVVSEK